MSCHEHLTHPSTEDLIRRASRRGHLILTGPMHGHLILTGPSPTAGRPPPTEQLTRTPAADEPGPTAQASQPPARAGGVSRDAAIAAARAAAPNSAAREVRSANLGPVGELLGLPNGKSPARALPAEQQVWVILLLSGESLGEEGSIVVVDPEDGSVIDVIKVRG